MFQITLSRYVECIKWRLLAQNTSLPVILNIKEHRTVLFIAALQVKRSAEIERAAPFNEKSAYAPQLRSAIFEAAVRVRHITRLSVVYFSAGSDGGRVTTDVVCRRWSTSSEMTAGSSAHFRPEGMLPSAGCLKPA